jgi:site-specific DNA-methyltransferase (adenine-specific)
LGEAVIDLRLGDCLEILPTLADKSVDAVITDPPYFLPVNSYVGKRGEGYTKRTSADASILRGYFERVFAELARIIRPTGTFYVFCDGQSYPIFHQVMYPFTKYVRPLIWDKVVSYNGYTWRHQHEIIAWGELEETPRIPTGDGDILKCRGVLQKDRVHPAEKPVDLLGRLIEKSVPAGGIVLDPFCGSASTGEACVKLGRVFTGIEMEKSFFEIAEKRITEAQQQMVMPL